MAVRTRRLGRLKSTSNGGDSTVYTCPTDRTAIIKDARLRVGSGATNVALYVLSEGSSYTLVLLPTPASGVVELGEFWTVLQEGDELRLFWSTLSGGAVELWVSGTELAGDPS